MTLTQQCITIAIAVGVTVFTRAIAFILFPEGKALPAVIRDLGHLLPAAALGMLVIYCLKDVSLFTGNHALPELIAIAVVVVLHLTKRNMFLSIIGGTACYMALLRWIF